MTVSSSDAAMTDQKVVMVAERTVGQAINDLRGELGVKFHQIENGENGIKGLNETCESGIKEIKTSIEEEINNLQDKIKLKNLKRILT